MKLMKLIQRTSLRNISKLKEHSQVFPKLQKSKKQLLEKEDCLVELAKCCSRTSKDVHILMIQLFGGVHPGSCKQPLIYVPISKPNTQWSFLWSVFGGLSEVLICLFPSLRKSHALSQNKLIGDQLEL